MRKLLAGFMVLFLVGILCNNASAANKEVSINVNVPSSMKVGNSFTLQYSIKNDDSDAITTGDDIDFTVYVEDVKVHEDTLHLSIASGATYNGSISSSSFNVDGDRIFTRNLMDYDCGEKTVKVEIGGDVSDESDDDTIEIKPDDTDYELSFSMDPDPPTLDQTTTFHVKDENSDDLKAATVKITYYGSNNKWNADDDKWEKDTDADGNVELKLKDKFDDDATGTFQVDAYKKDKYCKETKTFDISRNMVVSDPDITPQVGKTFKIKVTTEGGTVIQGALATLSASGINPIRSSTDASGYASFTVQQTGSYSLIVSKTGYTSSAIKTINVGQAAALSLSLSKTSAASGESIVMTVKADGAAVSGATVRITLPDGTSVSPATGSDGTTTYAPVLVGVYAITASKTGYADATASLRVENNLNVAIPDNKQKMYGKAMKVKVTDNSGNPLPDATIFIAGTSISGLTDSAGEYSFTAPEPGSYKLTASKSGYTLKEATLAVGGALTLKVEPKDASLGEQVNISVLNDAGKPISAEITITYPDGTTEKHTGEAATFAKEIAGRFNVTATKENFDTGTSSFSIRPKELKVTTSFNKNELSIVALSGGTPVSGLTIQIETPAGEIKTAETDENGMVVMAAEAAGDYKISAVSGVYESGVIKATKKGINWWLIALALLILVVSAVIVVVALLHASRRRKTSFDPGKKTKLQG